MKVALIGSGIIGLASAWRLARSGCDVTTYDANRESSEASWAAAGMLAPHNEAQKATDLWRLCYDSLKAWPSFIKDLDIAPEALDFHQKGSWIPIFSESEQMELQTKIEIFRSMGIHFRWHHPEEIRAKEPALNSHLLGAYHVEGAHVDPRCVVAHLIQKCLGLQVHMRYNTAVSKIDGGRLTLTSGESEQYDHIVLAAGAWTPKLSEWTGIQLEGEPIKGQMLKFAAHPKMRLQSFVHCEHAYAVQRQDGTTVIGSTMENQGFDRRDNPQSIEKLALGARKILPHLEHCDISETWTGLRPKLKNGLPHFQRVNDQLSVATGHFRNGILLTPISAEIVHGMVMHGLLPKALEP